MIVFCQDFDIRHKDSNVLAFFSTISSFFAVNIIKIKERMIHIN